MNFCKTAFAAIVMAVCSLAASASVNCGDDIACKVTNGDYRIKMPKDGDVRGVYVFFHGWKGSAKLQMQVRPLIETTLAHHLAFVAVDGTDGNWAFPEGNPGRDERAFISGVFDDLHSRWGFEPRNTVIGGFSIGASMAWYTVCQQGQRVSAMVTFSGVFWDPLPEPSGCVTDIPTIVHFHGSADETFPLAGRPIGTQYHQGDTFKSIAVLRAAARCDVKHPGTVVLDDIECNEIPRCIHGKSTLCIHKEGHIVRAADLDAGLGAVGYPR